MSLSAYFLKSVIGYSAEKELKDILRMIKDVGLYYAKEIRETEGFDGKFYSYNIGVFADDPLTLPDISEYQDGIGYQGSVTVCVNKVSKYTDDMDWIIPGKNLFQAISIDYIKDDALVLKLAAAYFKENPEDYFYADNSKWVISAADIEKIAEMPFDEGWMFKKVE